MKNERIPIYNNNCLFFFVFNFYLLFSGQDAQFKFRSTTSWPSAWHTHRVTWHHTTAAWQSSQSKYFGYRCVCVRAWVWVLEWAQTIPETLLSTYVTDVRLNMFHSFSTKTSKLVWMIWGCLTVLFSAHFTEMKWQEFRLHGTKPSVLLFTVLLSFR